MDGAGGLGTALGHGTHQGRNLCFGEDSRVLCYAWLGYSAPLYLETSLWGSPGLGRVVSMVRWLMPGTQNIPKVVVMRSIIFFFRDCYYFYLMLLLIFILININIFNIIINISIFQKYPWLCR